MAANDFNRTGDAREPINWREVATLLCLIVVAWLVWDWTIVLPLKILVVFFHELSHGLAAILTGGSIERIEVIRQQGGLCVTRGGNSFLITSAGYLGSLFWGGVILVLAARTRWDRTVSKAIGVVLVVSTLLWVRPMLSFGFFFGLAAGIGITAIGHFLPQRVNDYFLKFVGLTSCLYVLFDIKDDILDRPELRSDARILAEATGIPTLLWGVLWIVVAVIAAGFFLLYACRGETDDF